MEWCNCKLFHSELVHECTVRKNILVLLFNFKWIYLFLPKANNQCMWDEKHSLGGAKAFSGTTISSLQFPIIIRILTICLPSITLSPLYHNSSFFPNVFVQMKIKCTGKLRNEALFVWSLGRGKFCSVRYRHISEHRHKNISPGIYNVSLSGVMED